MRPKRSADPRTRLERRAGNPSSVSSLATIFSINRGKVGCVRAAKPRAHTLPPNY